MSKHTVIGDERNGFGCQQCRFFTHDTKAAFMHEEEMAAMPKLHPVIDEILEQFQGNAR